MWRSLLAAVAIYAYGHPGFDGYRPAAFERPLQAFHHEVNLIARDGQRALTAIGDAHAMLYLKGYMEAQIRPPN